MKEKEGKGRVVQNMEVSAFWRAVKTMDIPSRPQILGPTY